MARNLARRWASISPRPSAPAAVQFLDYRALQIADRLGGIAMRPAQRLGDDPIDDAQAPAGRRR